MDAECESIDWTDLSVLERKKQDCGREKPSERLNGSPDEIKQKVTVRAGV